MREIERTFLVPPERRAEALAGLTRSSSIVQGYLTRSVERTARIRIVDGTAAALTVKGPGLMDRVEVETAIGLEEGLAILRMCEPPLVVKTRFPRAFGGRLWEIDVFDDALRGLVLAEVELPSADTPLEIPPWAGIEVTHDPRYANARLHLTPTATLAGRRFDPGARPTTRAHGAAILDERGTTFLFGRLQAGEAAGEALVWMAADGRRWSPTARDAVDDGFALVDGGADAIAAGA